METGVCKGFIGIIKGLYGCLLQNVLVRNGPLGIDLLKRGSHFLASPGTGLLNCYHSLSAMSRTGKSFDPMPPHHGPLLQPHGLGFWL